MKNKFSFVQWLTNRDVEKIVELLGYEIMPQTDNPNKKRISRYKNEEHHIIVFCKDLISMENKKQKYSFLNKSDAGRNLIKNIGMVSLMLGVMDADNNYDKMNDAIILDITDFLVMESLSLKNEDEQIENARRMTKIFNNYMSKKFGRFYNGMKAAEIKKIYKEAREEKETQDKSVLDEM